MPSCLHQPLLHSKLYLAISIALFSVFIEVLMALLQWLSAALILASTILAVLIFVTTHRPKKRGTNLPPGPPPLPLVGNLHLLGRMPHLSLQRLAHKYGPIFHLTLGQIPTVIVSSARTAKEVLRTHDLPLSSRPQLYAAKQLFYGCTDIVFAPYGSYWRHARKICILELLSAKRVESYRPARAAEVDQLVRRIAAAASSSPGGEVNLSRLLGLYANGVLCRAALGRDFAEGGEYDRHGFQEMLDEYQVLLGGFSLGDFYPSLEWVSAVTGMKRRLERTFKRFDCFFDEIIEEHTKRRERTEEGGEEAKDLVDVLLEIQKDGSLEMPLTTDNVKAIILVSEY